MAYKHILLATGGSEHSRKAEEEALRLALALRSQLTALAVVQASSAENAMGMTAEYAERQQNLENYKKRCNEAGLSVETLLEMSNPGDAIIRVAQRYQCDLIVLGRRRLSLAATVVVGSVSDYVIRHALGPVLIVQ